eukprot:gnl/MRDRNA2_/MRDRNA2_105562_c0_seq1.p1 gnl/MRDRNA2_/MRDRNA2_105562_c0~~gnl/MRDRNA2_/MRDRNA2_105562_c0_seq1.p1  ORF type:complete len:200 (+),score=44.53 gnl/MRDRNA2_/MRDRNA2_105562_c0_seq1:86-685(+)
MSISLLVVSLHLAIPSFCGASRSCPSGDDQSITSIAARSAGVIHRHPQAAGKVTEWQGKSLFQIRTKSAKAVVFEDFEDEDQSQGQRKPASSAAPPLKTSAGNGQVVDPPLQATNPEIENPSGTFSQENLVIPPSRPDIWHDLDTVLSSQKKWKHEGKRDDIFNMLALKYDIDKDPAKKLQDDTQEQVAEARAFNLRPV